MNNTQLSERHMWMTIRAAVLGISKALEKFAKDDELLLTIHASLERIADAIDQRFKISKYKTS